MVRHTEPREIVPLKHNVAGAGQGHGQPENKPSGAIDPVRLLAHPPTAHNWSGWNTHRQWSLSHFHLSTYIWQNGVR